MSKVDCRSPIQAVCSQVLDMPKNQTPVTFFLINMLFFVQYFVLAGCGVGVEIAEPASDLAKAC